MKVYVVCAVMLLVPALQVSGADGVCSTDLTGGSQSQVGNAGLSREAMFSIDPDCWGEPFALQATGLVADNDDATTIEDWDICFEGPDETECSQASGDEAGYVPTGATTAFVEYFSGALGEFRYTAGEAYAGPPLDLPTPDPGLYQQRVLFQWDTTELDVIINLPLTPEAAWRVDALEASVDAWRQGIQAMAPAWLRDGLIIRDYTVGRDIIPPAALADPEIIITSMERGAVGIGIQPLAEVCTAQPEVADPWHRHADSPWAVMSASDCPTGLPLDACLVVNTNWMLHQNGMYDLNSHEFGHCLGLGHVGDALDFWHPIFPDTDIMSYQNRVEQVNCVSRPNILGLQFVFADALGAPRPDAWFWHDRGDWFLATDPYAYVQVDCPNAPPGPFGNGAPVISEL